MTHDYVLITYKRVSFYTTALLRVIHRCYSISVVITLLSSVFNSILFLTLYDKIINSVHLRKNSNVVFTRSFLKKSYLFLLKWCVKMGLEHFIKIATPQNAAKIKSTFEKPFPLGAILNLCEFSATHFKSIKMNDKCH